MLVDSTFECVVWQKTQLVVPRLGWDAQAPNGGSETRSARIWYVFAEEHVVHRGRSGGSADPGFVGRWWVVAVAAMDGQ